jgi:4-amino-4-deoxy-L-arabinose transferase-like glycosyltransferase
VRTERGTSWPLAYLVVVVVLLKVPTLGTPAYWDEMAWLGQAAWLGHEPLWRVVPGLRPDDAFWGHPPGLHLTAASAFKVFGTSIELTHLVILGFAVLGVVSTFLLARLLYDGVTAWLAALLLLLCPLYFAQAGMFLADLPVAALGVTCVYLALTRRYLVYLLCASYMVLLKETAAALVVALVVYLCLTVARRSRDELLGALRYGVPLLVLAAFVLVQRIATGEFFAIYEFEFQLFDPTLAAMQRHLELVTEWVFLHQYRWVLTAFIAADLLWSGVRHRKDAWLFGLIVLLSGYSFVALYFLPRYLLPVLPFFYALGAASVVRVFRTARVRVVGIVVLVAAAALALATQPFIGNGETGPRYLDVVSAHQAMADDIAARDPTGPVLTQWPFSLALSRPVLGYVDQPVRAIEYTRSSDLRRADLAVVTNAAEQAELRALLAREGWPAVQRVQHGDVVMVLHERPD